MHRTLFGLSNKGDKIKLLLKIFNKLNNKNYIDTNEQIGDMVYIWGIKSYDDLCNCDCGFYTMNDFDIYFLSDKNKYKIGIETVYQFTNGIDGEKEYILNIFNKFTEWMKSQGFKTDFEFGISDIFTYDLNNLNCRSEFNTIEDLYKTFKFFVRGFTSNLK